MSLICVAIALTGTLIITQVICVYLPFSYPKYAGSLFAANGLARSFFAGAAILFSPPMFEKLGIAGGVSLLAGFSVICSGGLFMLYYFGAVLDKENRFTSLESPIAPYRTPLQLYNYPDIYSDLTSNGSPGHLGCSGVWDSIRLWCWCWYREGLLKSCFMAIVRSGASISSKIASQFCMIVYDELELEL